MKSARVIIVPDRSHKSYITLGGSLTSAVSHQSLPAPESPPVLEQRIDGCLHAAVCQPNPIGTN